MPRTKAKARARRAEAPGIGEQARKDFDYKSRSYEMKALKEWQLFAAQEEDSRHRGSHSQPFTMAQEARKTEFYGSGWRSQGQLRNLPVNFVKPDHFNDIKQGPVDEERHDHSGDARTSVKQASNREILQIRSFESLSLSTASSSSNAQAGRKILNHTVTQNTNSNANLDASGIDLPSTVRTKGERAGVQNEIESQSSSDSEEMVLFNGRGRRPRQIPQRKRALGSTGPIQDDLAKDLQHASKELPPSEVSQNPSHKHDDESTTLPVRLSHREKSEKPGFRIHSDVVRYTPRYQERVARRERKRRAEEDAVLQDYIDNMISEDEKEPNLAVGETGPTTEDSGMLWSSDDIKDFNDLSTSDDEGPGDIKQILSRRDRASGVQYLVYANGQSIDDAKWIPSNRLEHAGELIRSFDAEHMAGTLEAAALEALDGTTSEDEEAVSDLLNEFESEDEEREATSGMAAAMTDEQIAQALAKQDMFGLPTDEVLLFDDAISDTGQSNGDMDLEDKEDELFRRHRNYNSKRSDAKSIQRGRRSDGFPSAAAFADALDQDPYGAFDIMDFERPSLKPKSKGRRGRPDLGDLADEELEAQLRQSWEKDRQKKKIKKLERQQLREEGRLGQRPGRIDMKAKYPRGMKRPHVRFEVKGFLLTSRESIAFPPMHAALRAHLHMLAAKAGLTSKSQGSGNERFTVLTKKKSTPAFDTLLEDDVNLLFAAGKVGKGKGRAQHSSSTISHRKGAGGVKSGAFYRDGEIVGAAAPELGNENKGRAMLEKMGWTSGTALGAVDNKGILQPVAHIVKNSKTGLG